MSDLLRAFKDCNKRIESGSIEPFTICQINEIRQSIINFRDGSSICETISKEVADFFHSYNFVISNRGIGFQIKRV